MIHKTNPDTFYSATITASIYVSKKVIFTNILGNGDCNMTSCYKTHKVKSYFL